MSFNLFTVPTGQDVFGIDLYVNSITGQVTNTRQNAYVRHNETNRFLVIPHSVPLKPADANYPVNFLRGTDNYTSYRIVQAELAARPNANTADIAFSVATTVTQNISPIDIVMTAENTISYFSYIYDCNLY